VYASKIAHTHITYIKNVLVRKSQDHAIMAPSKRAS